MEREAEFTGRKVQDAVQEGLQALGKTLDDVEIKIVSNGGLFKKAKVVIMYDDGKTEEQARQERQAEEEQKEEQRRKEREAAEAADEQPRPSDADVKREPDRMRGAGAKSARPPRQQRKNESDTATAGEDDGKTEKPPRDNKPHEKKNRRESVPPTEEQTEAARAFLTGLLERMKIEGTVEIAESDGMRINVNTEDARVIGHRGEVLDAMQQLISAQINTAHGKFVHVTVDGLGYRDRRKDSLESLARRMADKAVRTHRKVSLDAMNSADRRIVHAALGERDDVFTKSEGHDPARRVVIIPKRR